MTGAAAACQGHSTGLLWSAEERAEHINYLELKAAKLVILTFIELLKVESIHLQTDSMVALTYLVNMGGTSNSKMTQLSKEIWEFLLNKGITITVEHLPGVQIVQAERREIGSSCFSETMQSKGLARHRSVCFEGVSPGTFHGG